MADSDAIARFWVWWPTVVARLKPATEPVRLEELDELVRRVEEIHPKIQVLGRYKPDAESWLCLSSRGNLEIRALVETWARGAPNDAAEAGWRFLTARPPSWPPDRKAGMALEEFVAAVERDELTEVIHVVLHHPNMQQLEPMHRDSLAFVALDHLLGENAVERWLGNVEVSDVRPTNAMPIAALHAEVKALAAHATGERWQAIRAGGKRNPLLITINRALKPLDHVGLPIHLRIDLMLQAPNRHGLATGKEALELDDLQAELTRHLGRRAVLIARETHQGHRILHLHADLAAIEQVKTWRQKYPQWTIALLTQPDPQWHIMRRWGDVGSELRSSSFPPSPSTRLDGDDKGSATGG